MPVFLLVASNEHVPGLISALLSPTIIDSAARSLTDPAGLLPSSLTQISLPLSRPHALKLDQWSVADGVFECIHDFTQ